MLRVKPRTVISSLNRGFATKKAAPKPSSETQMAVSSLLHRTLAEKVAQYEHKDAFRHVPGKIRWTFLELKKNTDHLGHVLGMNNMSPKTNLLILLNNELESISANISATKVGVVPTYASTGLDSEQLDTLFRAVKPKTVLFHTKSTPVSEIDKLIPQMTNADSAKEAAYPWQYPYIKQFWHVDTRAHYNGMTPLVNMTKLKNDPYRADDYHEDTSAHPTADQPAVILAKPNGELTKLSHATILGSAAKLVEKVQLGINDRVALVSPFPTAGTQVAMWAAIQSGAVSIVPALQFNRQEVLEALATEKATVVVGQKEHVEELLAGGLREEVPTVVHVVSVSDQLEFTVHQ